MNLHFAARSHIGNVRKNNEDNLYCNGTILTPQTRDAPFAMQGEVNVPCIFAVSDGMGGESDGEQASFLTMQTLSVHADKIKHAGADTDAEVQAFVSEANEQLCTAMRKKSARMGTTLAMVVIDDECIRPYNIGDSRIYVLREGDFRKISTDHTLAEQKTTIGILTAEQAKKDPSRHTLTRHIGVFEDEMKIEAEILHPLRVETGLKLLICSDGLTEMVDDRSIENILRSSESPNLASERLENEALRNGGKDNVTCVVIEITE